MSTFNIQYQLIMLHCIF